MHAFSELRFGVASVPGTVNWAEFDSQFDSGLAGACSADRGDPEPKREQETGGRIGDSA
jgi:hypothetical protein